MNLKSYPQITQFLKDYCYCYKESGEEIIVFCPYCDDAHRRPGRLSHGHLYISTLFFVFHCFRCGTSGHVLKLLTDLKFNDQNILNELKRIYPHYNFGSTIVTGRKDISINQIYKKLYLKWTQTNGEIVKNVVEYLRYRFGNIDLNWFDFLLAPDVTPSNETCVKFYNFNNEFCCYRNINTKNKFRYFIPKNQDVYYYFQPLNSIINKKNIIITEGPFDLISFSIFNGQFTTKDSYFISALGKKHVSCFKWLLLNGLFYNNDYNIFLVFDEDVKNPRIFKLTIKKILKNINKQNINIHVLQAKYGDVDNVCLFKEVK